MGSPGSQAAGKEKISRLSPLAWCAGLLLVACGGGGGGVPTSATPNPLPSVSSLSPSSTTTGRPGFTLTVTGSGFVASSRVRWNGSDRTTTFVSSTELRAAILATDIATGGTAQVSVFNPAPGGGTSNALSFPINNPIPTVTALSPSTAAAGGPGFTLAVSGSNFVSVSVVRWNGSDRATTFVSAGQLQASISSSDIAVGGTAQVSVFNPAPGGGVSNALTFSISFSAPVLMLPTQDLIYDPTRNRIYASVPSSGGAMGNSIVTIDPVTLQILPSVFIGSEPGKLAISDDAQSLYVALDGAAAVRRLDLATQSPGLQFALGTDSFFGPLYAEDIEVLPGDANAAAVSRRFLSVSPRHAGVAIYDDGIKRPTETPGHTGSNVIEFSTSPSTLYGYNNETTEFGFRRMLVDASGVTVLDATGNLISGFGVDIEFDGGLIYATTGRVLDPTTLTLVGTYSGIPFGALVEPDSTVGRVFFLTGSEFSSTRTLLAFAQHTFIQVGSLDIAGVSGRVGSLIRWGADGFAFRTSNNQVFLFRAPELVRVQPLTITTTQLPPTAGGKAYDFTLSSAGGTPPTTWSIATGSLPTSFTLNTSTGRISGQTDLVTTDTVASFTAQVTDSSNPPQTDTQDLSITVRAGPLGRNDSCPAPATPISNGSLRASLSPYGDVDVYSFQGTQGAVVTIETVAQRLELDGDPLTLDSFADTVLELLDRNCSQITFNDDIALGVIVDSSISFTLPTTGTFFIRVRDFRGDGRPDLIYELRLSGTD